MVKRVFYAPQAVVLTPNLFGLGFDGDVVLTGDWGLDRDYYFNSLTILPGVTVQTNNYRIFSKNFVLNRGTILARGNAAVGQDFGAGLPAGYWGYSGDGGACQATTGNGFDPADWLGLPFISSDGNLGFGGSTSGRVGGAYDTANNYWDLLSMQTVIQASEGFKVNIDVLSRLAGGVPGGGGSVNPVNGVSGCGGGGGGIVAIYSRVINNTNGIIDTRGGNGSAAAVAGPSGGGGGGTGGPVILVGLHIQKGTCLTAGGTGGAGFGGGDPGEPGGEGDVFEIAGI